jgi:thymidine kinase
MNLRVEDSGAPVRHGAQTEIGGNDRYLTLCRRHFAEALDLHGAGPEQPA